MSKTIFYCSTYHHLLIAVSKVIIQKIDADLIVAYEHSAIDPSIVPRLKEAKLFQRIYEYVHPDRWVPSRRKPIQYLRYRYFEIDKYMKQNFPVNIHEYDEIYTFYDANIFGFYINIHKIPYHLIEDAKGVFTKDTMEKNPVGKEVVKRYMCENNFLENILFKYGVCPGIYGNPKNCIDIRVSSLEGLLKNKYTKDKFVLESESILLNELKEDDWEQLFKIFATNLKLPDLKNAILILTSAMVPDHFLHNMDEQRFVFKRIIDRYKSEGVVVIKPHPRDLFDYASYFSEKNVICLDRKFPSEILAVIGKDLFNKYVTINSSSVFTFPKDKVVILGMSYLEELLNEYRLTIN